MLEVVASSFWEVEWFYTGWAVEEKGEMQKEEYNEINKKMLNLKGKYIINLWARGMVVTGQ
jgi:hypothetical protein